MMNNPHLDWWPNNFFLHQFTRDAFLKLEKHNLVTATYLEYLKLLPLIQKTIVIRTTNKVGNTIYEFIEDLQGYEIPFFNNPEQFTKLYFLKYEEKLRYINSSDSNKKDVSLLSTNELLNILQSL